MRYISFVFLAFCAFGALAGDYDSFEKYPEVNNHNDLAKLSSDGILENIQKLIEEFVQRATDTINEIIERFNKIVSNVQSKIEELIQRAKNNLDDILQNIKGILEDLVAQNEAAKQCVDRYSPQLESIIENAKMDIGFCQKDAFTRLQAIKTKIQGEIDAIRSQLADLSEILKDCYESSSNPISASQCALQKFKEIKITISMIISHANQAVAIATKEAGIIISTTNRCVGRTISDARSQTKTLMDKINECIDLSNIQKIIMLN